MDAFQGQDILVVWIADDFEAVSVYFISRVERKNCFKIFLFTLFNNV